MSQTQQYVCAQIVHRDLKSANILLARDGGACIAVRLRGSLCLRPFLLCDMLLHGAEALLSYFAAMQGPHLQKSLC